MAIFAETESSLRAQPATWLLVFVTTEARRLVWASSRSAGRASSAPGPSLPIAWSLLSNAELSLSLSPDNRAANWLVMGGPSMATARAALWRIQGSGEFQAR